MMLKHFLKSSKYHAKKAGLLQRVGLFSATSSLFCSLCCYPLQGNANEFMEGEDYYSYPQPLFYEDPSAHFFISGDLLWWKPHISGLELDYGNGSTVETITADDRTTETFTETEFDIDPRFKWNAGFRIASGYMFPCSNWEVDSAWTHFQSKGTRNVREDATTVNSGKTRVKLDQVDLILAYNASLMPCLACKPFMGVRAARLSESVFSILVTDITLPTGTARATRTFDDHQHSRGIGPLIGMQADYDLGCGFGIYGGGAAGLLYGRFKVHFDDSDITVGPTTTTEFFSTNTRRLHGFDCNIDLALGVRWQTCLCDLLEVTFRAGFEHHEYFNQSHLGAGHGDVSFDGGVFSLDATF